MRLHRLEATAFGPFASRTEVDFDELCASGLFLLTGATGAGKTSILDAVCFALFGQVPGDRHVARHLRCDQAAAGVAPEVQLEASVRGRRFRFTRSPQWERPKKRGSGTTRVQAHVVVEELRDGVWTGLTNRLDDAGLLVTDLLGMNCAQFTQVAMLPQGQFMTFLRSRSQDRQAVLQRLFRTDRFEQVERWLVERRIGLRRANQAANDEAASVLSRIQEAADAALPDDWDTSDLRVPVEEGGVLGWCDDVVRAAAEHAARTALAKDAALNAAERARGQLEAARRLAAARERGIRARDAESTLAASCAAVDGSRARIDAHHRAAPALPNVARVDAATATARQTADRLADALGAAAALLPEPALERLDDGHLARAHETATAAVALAEAFLPRERELRRQQERARGLAARVTDDERGLAELAREASEAPARLASLTADRDAARSEAAQLGAAQAALTEATRRVAQVRRTEELTAQIEVVAAEVTAATDRTQQLRQDHLDARERRITGMAAELALGLAVGCACPVCGSADHPALAVSGTDAVTAEAEDAARRRYEEADFDRQVREHHLHDLTSSHRALVEELGDQTSESVREELAEAEAAVHACEQAARTARGLDDAVERAEAHRRRREEQVHRLEVALSRDSAALQAARETVDSLSTELATLLGELTQDAEADLAALLEQQRAAVGTFERARRAVAEHAAAGAVLDAARAALADALDAAGFATVADVRAAQLTDDVLARLTEELVRHEEEHQRVAATLADPEVRAALDTAAPDLGALEEAAASTTRQRDQAVSAADAARRSHARLTTLHDDLAIRLEEWTPLRRQYAMTASLAALAEGKGTDNPQRIRLSAFVLSERLRQVVDAANERLIRMSGGRYELAHTDEKGAGDQRGGLGLLVLDSWSGRSRDPATLSGGETFVVSLALALGLADTVSHEAGGTDIDTLFIDEGFGTLDAATLDDVMDTLDTLREGGRVVGLVSHVAELRQRVPSQLEISSSRRGSTVRSVTRTA